MLKPEGNINSNYRNYAPTIMNAVNAKKNGGHGQVLYLVDGKCT